MTDLWKISDSMVNWIEDNIAPGSRILELGSGNGTKVLHDLRYKMTSVEHDKSWVGKYEEVDYVYAAIKEHKPIKGFAEKEWFRNQWYDKEVIAEIPWGYSCIIVDGPPQRIGRPGFIKYLNLFDTRVPILFDDVHRRIDHKIIHKVSAKLRRPLTIYDTWKPKHWGVV